ncbi:MAG: ATP-binding protein [Bacteroidota bacterium]
MYSKNYKEPNILIVDDEQANIDVLLGLLEIQGYKNLETTTNPGKVLDLYYSFKPDLILLDLMMSPLNGFDIMEKLREVHPRTSFLPILVLTADVTTESRQRALAGGANDFLTKPFDLIEVDLRIKNLLETRFLSQQLELLNASLELKVRERTVELELLNKSLRASKEKAEESDNLKTSFLQNISHEIRTPLNGITGFVELLNSSENSEKERTEFMAVVKESSLRFLNTINELILMSKIETGQFVPDSKEVDLQEILGDISAFYFYEANQKGLQFKISENIFEVSCIVKCDASIIHKVLTNLVSNALKYTHTGSIEMGYIKDGTESIIFYVEDSGIGIRKEVSKSMFDRFRQGEEGVNRGFEGSGLGLSVSKALVELHGGKIWYQPNRTQGSIFYFSIPLQGK